MHAEQPKSVQRIEMNAYLYDSLFDIRTGSYRAHKTRSSTQIHAQENPFLKLP